MLSRNWQNKLQHTETRCNILQHIATQCKGRDIALRVHRNTHFTPEGQRPIGCSIFWSYFPQKNPIIRGSFAENDLQLKTSYASSPSCMTCLISKARKERNPRDSSINISKNTLWTGLNLGWVVGEFVTFVKMWVNLCLVKNPRDTSTNIWIWGSFLKSCTA